MKSYVKYLQGLYKALFVTVAEYFPTLRCDCERDASRLLSLVDKRGLSFLMIDLPEMGKHFDRCLSIGHLTKSGLPGQRAYRTGVSIPRLFKGLILRVFDENGLLRDNPDVASIRLLRQLYYAAKKAKVPCNDSRTWEHVHEFFEVDREVRSPSLKWDEDELRIDHLQHLHIGDDSDGSPAPLFDVCGISTHRKEKSLSNIGPGLADAVQRTADIVAATIGGFDPIEWRAKHGPGAVADQHHTQFKYDFPTWPAKLEKIFPMSAFGFSNYEHWVEFSTSQDAYELFSAHEPPSRLIAVPKTLKGPRLIACEPVSHQWCQQTVLDFLTSRLADTPISRSIHFRDQTENQEFARRASHTQSHVTVDLSSASDRLSCWLVERIFRRNSSIVEALHACRTRWVVNTIDRLSPKYHLLRKFACMGSACTFPVQSYVFSILAISSVLYARKMVPSIRNLRTISREVRIFGDDIVIPKDGWEVLQGVLDCLDLKVNRSKTYDTGRFRESCGMDAYDGHDVTPVYTITHPDVSRPESIASVVSTHNNFLNRNYFAVGAYVKSTVHKLKRFAFPYVPMGSGAFGWYDPFSRGNDHLKRRWNPRLQVVEHLMDSVRTVVRRVPVERGSVMLQYFSEVRQVPFIQGERLGKLQRPSTSIRRRWVNMAENAILEPFL